LKKIIKSNANFIIYFSIPFRVEVMPVVVQRLKAFSKIKFFKKLYFVKWGYRVTKENKLILFKVLKDEDSEIDAAFAQKNLLFYAILYTF
jgi:hypothetical protein